MLLWGFGVPDVALQVVPVSRVLGRNESLWILFFAPCLDERRKSKKRSAPAARPESAPLSVVRGKTLCAQSIWGIA